MTAGTIAATLELRDRMTAELSAAARGLRAFGEKAARIGAGASRPQFLLIGGTMIALNARRQMGRRGFFRAICAAPAAAVAANTMPTVAVTCTLNGVRVVHQQFVETHFQALPSVNVEIDGREIARAVAEGLPDVLGQTDGI
jgi:hypothetical protein